MTEAKKFTFIQFLFFIIFTFSFMYFNVRYDTYGIFSKELKPLPTFDYLNLRINKFNYLESNYNLYNSFLIGGSRALTFKESELNYYTNEKFFNYAGIRSDMYDNLIFVRYILKKQKVNTIVIQIGVDDLYIYSENNENLINKSHFKLLDENEFNYYFRYIFSFDIKKTLTDKYIKDTLKLNYSYKVQDEFLLYSMFEEQIKTNPTMFFNQQFAKNKFLRLPIYKKNKIKENIEALKEIKKLSDAEGTRLIVFTAPLNHLLYRKINEADLNIFLNQIAEVTPFWNFTTLNSVTLDNTNYYDHYHYRYNVASLVLAKIFNDTSIKVPEDFGTYIKK